MALALIRAIAANCSGFFSGCIRLRIFRAPASVWRLCDGLLRAMAGRPGQKGSSIRVRRFIFHYRKSAAGKWLARARARRSSTESRTKDDDEKDSVGRLPLAKRRPEWERMRMRIGPDSKHV